MPNNDLSPQSKKSFLLAFLLVVAGGFIFVGNGAMGHDSQPALFLLAGALIFFGVLTGLFARVD